MTPGGGPEGDGPQGGDEHDEFARIFDDDFVRGAELREESHRQRERAARAARKQAQPKVVPLRRRRRSTPPVSSRGRSLILLLLLVGVVAMIGRLGHHNSSNPRVPAPATTVSTAPATTTTVTPSSR